MQQNRFNYILFIIILLVFNNSLFGQVKNKKFNFKSPFVYSQYFDSSDSKTYSVIDFLQNNNYQIITDSVEIKLEDGKDVYLYFLTSLKENVIVQCPDNFGLLAFDAKQNLIYSNFNLPFNTFYGIDKIITTKSFKYFLKVAFSGCGSGFKISYYDIKFNDSIFYLGHSGMRDEETGYSFIKFYPSKNSYLFIEKYQPQSHYSSSSRYQISYYNLTTSKLHSKLITKYFYPDYSDIGNDQLLNKIKYKEPNILKY
jgi:hypothetical protein